MEARMKFKTGWFAAAAFAALALASPATAHHTADNLNFDSTVEVTGTVKEFQWTSPYTMLALEVEGEGGAAEEWLIDMNSPGMLMRRGWSEETLKPGDEIAVTVYPLLDGAPGGRAVSVVLPDGTVTEQ